MEELLTEVDPARQTLISVIYITLFILGIFRLISFIISYRKRPLDSHALTLRISRRALLPMDLGLILSTYLILYMLASLTGTFFTEQTIVVGRLLITLLIYALVTWIIFRICQRNNHSALPRFGLQRSNLVWIKQVPSYYLETFPLLIGASLIYQFILISLGVELEAQAVSEMLIEGSQLEQIILALMAVILAPFFEELLFRGLIFPALTRYLGLSGGIVLTSLLFAWVHFNLPATAPLFVFSAATCFAYWRTGSLWVCIGMHAVFNFISIFSLLHLT